MNKANTKIPIQVQFSTRVQITSRFTIQRLQPNFQFRSALSDGKDSSSVAGPWMYITRHCLMAACKVNWSLRTLWSFCVEWQHEDDTNATESDASIPVSGRVGSAQSPNPLSLNRRQLHYYLLHCGSRYSGFAVLFWNLASSLVYTGLNSMRPNVRLRSTVSRHHNLAGDSCFEIDSSRRSSHRLTHVILSEHPGLRQSSTKLVWPVLPRISTFCREK